jgi:hypothetical protein
MELVTLAYIEIIGPSVVSHWIRTVWIVLFLEEVARFVAAIESA